MLMVFSKGGWKNTIGIAEGGRGVVIGMEEGVGERFINANDYI